MAGSILVGFYQGYSGRSVGRILGLIEKYCGLKYAEEVCVGDAKVTYHGEHFADYRWIGESDIPWFTFYELPKHFLNGIDQHFSRKQSQLIYFADKDRYSPLESNFTYYIQELGRELYHNPVLTLTEAKYWVECKVGTISWDSAGHLFQCGHEFLRETLLWEQKNGRSVGKTA